MNKKAILKKEVLNIVLAVIAIGLLIYLAVGLYGILTEKNELEKAKATLSDIVGKVKAVEKGKVLGYTLTGPKGWYLVWYDKEIVEADVNKNMPEKCGGKDCLCICPTEKLGLLEKPIELEIMGPIRGVERGGWPDYFYREGDEDYDGLDMCQGAGVCENVENIFIQNVRTYRVWEVQAEVPEKGNVNWIAIRNLPKEINILQTEVIIYIKEK